MVYSSENIVCSSLSNNKSVVALENTLHQSINHLKELVIEFDQLQVESDDYKTQVTTLEEKCESKLCVGSEALKKVIELKDNIIQSVASALTRLNETKDMSIIDEAFKILCGETVSLTPPKDSADFQLKTPKKESPSFTEAINDESVSEIEGTPTGRTSPIIVSRKARNASDYREKKKCPDNWPTPKNKALKLTYPNFCTPPGKGKGKLRQTRFTTVKQTSVLDISSSPEFVGLRSNKDTKSMQLNIKRESLDDEDTIEPSPTSITSNFSSISAVRSSPLKLNRNSPHKIIKGSPAKLSLVKKPHPNMSKLQIKTEGSSNVDNVENKLGNSDIKMKMEDSINLLRPPRFRTPERSPAKLKDPNETECNIDSSISLLHHVQKLEKTSPDRKNICSPTKRPLAENINFTNLQTQCDTEASVSLLNHNHFIDNKKDLESPNKNPTFQGLEREANRNPVIESIIKKDLERLEPKRENGKVDVIFKEPTVRKKAEKRALPGWSCDECKNFYAELYKNDPVMLAKKMDECSKHRGRRDPARPRTPPGFWDPRWDVPEDTEEFNRRNNAG
ncbi:uncharacterized protein LOC133524048 isoform X2 [Cydia pomonella]|uniref:uncharacterized protein LOC133524048 isoform X2 n=1 Tax=Cydia pomonella TaxID=82600 RepID=UPI002ADD90EF|nr:uncharacterized protein LOC133524048 isoform X2 [Cydia pomonella]